VPRLSVVDVVLAVVVVDVEVRVVDVGLVGVSGQSVQHLLHLRRSGLLPPSDTHRLHTPDRLPDASALANSEMQSLLSYLPQVSVEVVAVVVVELVVVDVEVVVVERVVDVGLVGASGQSVQHLLHLRRSGLLPPSDKHRLHTLDRLPDASALANSEMQSLLSYLPQVSVEMVAVVVVEPVMLFTHTFVQGSLPFGLHTWSPGHEVHPDQF